MRGVEDVMGWVLGFTNEKKKVFSLIIYFIKEVADNKKSKTFFFTIYRHNVKFSNLIAKNDFFCFVFFSAAVSILIKIVENLPTK